MRQKKVIEIVVPYQEGTPYPPAVTMNDKIVHAVELMVNNGIHQIAVVRNNRPVGMIRLEDAFRKLGLQGPLPKDRAYFSRERNKS
ncbi:MAG: CBS domain-containing protein [Desulfobacterales bacterium]|nr:CBS domain-containing protein [Desulfobacterales bacterium]